jgi:hypothetical protein
MIWIANGVEQVSYYFTTFLGANNSLDLEVLDGMTFLELWFAVARTTYGAFLEGQIKIVDAARSGDHSNPISVTPSTTVCAEPVHSFFLID